MTIIHGENPLELLSFMGEIIAVFQWVAQIFVGYIPIRLDNCFHPNEKHYKLVSRTSIVAASAV